MMKKLLYIAIAFIPFVAFAVTGGSAKFDFTYGEPTIVDDQTSTCNDTATIRYDFVSGEPQGVLDATANCTSALVQNQPTLLVQGQIIINGSFNVQ